MRECKQKPTTDTVVSVIGSFFIFGFISLFYDNRFQKLQLLEQLHIFAVFILADENDFIKARLRIQLQRGIIC